MTVIEALFSFRGRMSRADYWTKGFPLLLAAGLLNNALAYGVGTELAKTIAMVIGFAGLWPTLALVIKRLHDRDRLDLFTLIVFVPIVGPIWLLLEVWFLRGTIGPNRFGDDPVRRSA